MFDDIRPGGGTHQFEWLLHTDTKHKIEPREDGHYVFSGNAELHAWLLEPRKLSAKTSEKFNLRSLTVKVEERLRRGFFVSVLYPKATNMQTPEVKRLAGDGFVGASVKGEDVGGEDVILFAQAGGPISSRGWETDGKILGLFPGKGEKKAYIAVRATYLRLGGQELFKADKPVTVALDPAGGGTATLAEGRAQLTIRLGGRSRTIQLEGGSTPLSMD